MGLFTVLALPLGGAGTDSATAGEAVQEHRGFGALEWVSTAEHAGATLVVGGPDGFHWEQSFAAGERVDFPFAAVAGGADGLYKYEVVFHPALAMARDEDLAAFRGGELLADALPSAPARSGTFRILNGAVVDADLPETGGRPGGSANHADPGQPGPEAALFNENLYVRGSECLGFDCVNGEGFGFDTLRLKENNLRIHFHDTSTSASFPSNDWRITINDSANGGLNRFSIDDASGGRTPFTIEARAPNDALYVEAFSGDVGLGTSTPALKLSLADGDTPGVRLEQNGSSGFTPQTWDVAGNEFNFFVRDATSGSRLPLRIRTGAPSDSLFIDPDGDVGLGDSSPDSRLHVRKNDLPPGTDLVTYESNGAVRTAFRNTANGTTWFQNNSSGGHYLISDLDSGPVNIEFRLRPNGNLEISGSLTENSDRDTKTNIEAVDRQEVLEAVAGLDVTRWSFKEEPDTDHIGPMAQDFHAAFGLGATEKRISPRDVAGVALLAIQGLAEEKDREIEGLQARLAALEAKLEALTQE